MCRWCRSPIDSLWYPSCRRETELKVPSHKPPREGSMCPWCGTKVLHRPWSKRIMRGLEAASRQMQARAHVGSENASQAILGGNNAKNQGG